METSTPETEMREIFSNTLRALSEMRDKVITTVVAHSSTARELAELRERFDRLTERMNAVVDEAQRSRQDLHMSIVERDKYKREAEDNLSLAQGYERERDDARQRISQAEDALRNVEVRLHEVTNQLTQTNALNERLRSDLEWTQDNRNRYREQAEQAEKEKTVAQDALKEANYRLEKVQESFKSIFGDKVEALPGVAPTFQIEHAQPVESGPHPVQSAGEENQQEDTRWWNKPAAQ